MALRRGSPRGAARIASPRRLVAWDEGVGGTATLAISTTTPAFLGSAVTLVAGVSKVTVVRFRGMADFLQTAADAGNSGFAGAIGIGIASLAAVTAGIASVPTPITEADSASWLWHSFFNVHGVTASPTWGNDGSGYLRMEIDSKAMRKVTTEDAIYAAVEAGTETGTATMQVRLNTRMLVKLA